MTWRVLSGGLLSMPIKAADTTIDRERLDGRRGNARKAKERNDGDNRGDQLGPARRGLRGVIPHHMVYF
jgi:hypothetical protein